MKRRQSVQCDERWARIVVTQDLSEMTNSSLSNAFPTAEKTASLTVEKTIGLLVGQRARHSDVSVIKEAVIPTGDRVKEEIIWSMPLVGGNERTNTSLPCGICSMERGRSGGGDRGGTTVRKGRPTWGERGRDGGDDKDDERD
jgi:hypothetical protein